MPAVMRRRGIVLWALAGMAAAAWAQAPADVIGVLRQSGELRCEPQWPQFCANVHVTCAGHTRIGAPPFTLQAAGSTAKAIAAADGVDNLPLRPYANARAEWDSQGAYLLLRPDGTQGYIKLQADGTYSFRHYVGAVGVMSIGRCVRADRRRAAPSPDEPRARTTHGHDP
jgi:hypothetical protein